MSTGEKLKPFINFLEDNKELVGLSDWKVMVSIGVDSATSHAEVEPDIYEKELKIGLSEEFFVFDETKQANILLHELLHGRLEIYRKHLKEQIIILEEHLVNDLVRGFERHSKLNLK